MSRHVPSGARLSLRSTPSSVKPQRSATQELGVYDAWVEKSFERLAVLRPARYRRLERAELVQRTLEATR